MIPVLVTSRRSNIHRKMTLLKPKVLNTHCEITLLNSKVLKAHRGMTRLKPKVSQTNRTITLMNSKVLKANRKITHLKSKVLKTRHQMTLVISQSSLKAPSASRSPPDPCGTLLDCPGVSWSLSEQYLKHV